MTRRKLIEEGWSEYKNMLGLDALGKVQIIETRNAFYSGAFKLFNAMIENVSQGTEDTPEDEKLMEDLAHEFSEYQKSLPPIRKPNIH